MYDTTNPDWAPTVNLGHNKVNPATSASDTSRYQRALDRTEKQKDNEAASALIQLGEITSSTSDSNAETGTTVQTDLSGVMISGMQAELQRLIIDNQRLKDELKQKTVDFDVDFFKEDNEKVKYYTGLPDFCNCLLYINI